MDERMQAVRDHIQALHAEAEAARVARPAPATDPVDYRGGTSLRQRAGHALIALGTILEGRPEECHGCPEAVSA